MTFLFARGGHSLAGRSEKPVPKLKVFGQLGEANRPSMMPAQAPDFTYSCQASTEHFEQCAEFPLLRNRILRKWRTVFRSSRLSSLSAPGTPLSQRRRPGPAATQRVWRVVTKTTLKKIGASVTSRRFLGCLPTEHPGSPVNAGSIHGPRDAFIHEGDAVFHPSAVVIGRTHTSPKQRSRARGQG